MPRSVLAQLLKQDAKGKSTILSEGEIIGFDLQDQSLQFSLARILGRPQQHGQMHLGFNARGKNKDGIASLFSGRIQSPEAKIDLTIGYVQIDQIPQLYDSLKSQISEISDTV